MAAIIRTLVFVLLAAGPAFAGVAAARGKPSALSRAPVSGLGSVLGATKFAPLSGPNLSAGRGIMLSVLDPASGINAAHILAQPALPLAAPQTEATAVLPALESLESDSRAAGQGAQSSTLSRFYDQDGRRPAAVDAAPASAAVLGDFADKFRVPYAPRGQVDLARVRPGHTPGMKHKAKAAAQLEADKKKIFDLQNKLMAEGQRSILVILQGMDTSGKDGVIRWVIAGLNPLGLKATAFKKPTPKEARHHYLWRIRQALPAPGQIGVFSRSQYEDILVPEVYETLPRSVVEARYEEINEFEKKLAAKGVTILKFYLGISKDEQKIRLEDRRDNPVKRHKLSLADLESRKRWDEFQDAYGKVLARTSTPWAPWHVIPANKKWYRNYAVGRILRETLEAMDPRFPRPAFDPEKVVIPD
ncbi:MAG TPA: hypothetical protein DEB40_07500 [Elusimicrobia bacterium]|nr:hypothetical protein [Elusimicrobiota bacterium]HBT61573.1 hypothetical protein [Elusimicrobiota bacterium]